MTKKCEKSAIDQLDLFNLKLCNVKYVTIDIFSLFSLSLST